MTTPILEAATSSSIFTVLSGAGSGGVFIPTTSPSSKVFADDLPVYSGPISGNISGAFVGTYVQINPLEPATISPTAQKTFTDDLLVMRQSDFTTATITCLNASPPFDEKDFIFTVTINQAGQNRVRVN